QIALTARLNDIAPSLRPRIAAMLGASLESAPTRSGSEIEGDLASLEERARLLDHHWFILAGISEALSDVHMGKLSAPGLHLNPLDIPRLDPAMRLKPISDLDELIGTILSVIENDGPSD